ncbi:hypothetical protein ACEPAH_7885 [Sanghuangporus vaninii]
MFEPTHYALEVVRVEGMSKKTKKSSTLYVEVKLGKIIGKTVTLDGDGKPAWKGTLAFSLSDTSAVLAIQLKENRKLGPGNPLGRADIQFEEFLQEIGQNIQRSLSSPPSRLFPQRRTGSSGIIHLHLEKIDALRLAEIEVSIAEHGAETIKNLLDRHLPVVETIGLFVEAGDKIFEAIDKAPGVTSIVTLSWKSTSALFKLVSDQYKGDKDLIGLAERMKTAFEFSDELSGSLDRREDLKPRLKQMLHETVECSRFVQEYSRHSFPGRMVLGHKRQKIKDYKDRFVDLRRDLNTAMLKKIVSHQDLTDLKEKLGPFTSMSDVSKRPRCIPGTRTKYLEQINDFLKSKTSPNIFWLTGAAGTGKSTIAASTSDEHGHGTIYLFFERGMSDPNDAIRRIACKLAERYWLVGQHIIKVVGESMNIKDRVLEDHFKKLLLEPLRKVEIPDTIVIILDALDECGSTEQRRELLQLLKTKFTELPPKIRILVTSRREGDIMEDLPQNDRIRHIELDHRTEESRHDVDLYIRQEMANALGKRVPKKKARDDSLQVLCDAADGLFIWASTAIKMVSGPGDRRRNLQQLADIIRSLGEHGLYGLYTTALKGSEIWQSNLRDVGTSVLGLILVAKESFTGATIEAFLGLEEDTADLVLSQLQSVISYEAGKPVRLHHASFADYLLSSQRSDDRPWHIDEIGRKQAVTERCFDTMTENLRFNMCDIESSFFRNEDVPDLQTSIVNNIRPHLEYACRFWSVHLCELSQSAVSTKLKDRTKRFGNEHLLCWFEVLSLTGQFNHVAVRALYNASMWSASIDEEIHSLFWAAYRLASVFAYPISQSAPHIYLSAISLWKGESLIADHYSKSHPVVKVDRLGIRTPSQCIKVLKGHTNCVNLVAVSADGERIASGSYDKTIRVWSAFSGELIAGPFEAVNAVWCVAISPDGKQVVSGSDEGTIHVWDVDTGNCVSVFKASDSSVASVAFSQDGKRVIAVSDEKVFYYENCKVVPAPFEDDTGVEFRKVSSDGKYVIGSKDSTIGIWDAGTGKRVSAPFNVGAVYGMAVSSDGKLLATVSGSRVWIWNVDSGELVKELSHVTYVYSVGFSPDGKYVALGGYAEISIWDVDSGQPIWSSLDNTVRIWDVNGSTEIASREFEAHTNMVTSVAFSADGKRIVSGSWDYTIHIWDADTGKHLVGPFKGHTHWVLSVSFSPDSKHVLSSSEDETIRIWNAETGELLAGPFEAHLEAAGCTGTDHDGAERHRLAVYSVAFSPNRRHFVSPSCDNTICIRDADSGTLVLGPFRGHTNRVDSVAYSPDGKRVVSGSVDMTIRIWDADSGHLVLDPLEGHTGPVNSVAFSSNGERVASGSVDETIRIWDTGTGKLISGPLKGHTSIVTSVCFSPDGRCVVSGSGDKTICIWDSDTGELILGPQEGHTSAVLSVAIPPNGTRIVSGSADETIRVWDVGDGVNIPGRGGRLAKGTVSTSSSSHRADAYTDSNDQGTGPAASRERTFSNWTLSEDGWLDLQNSPVGEDWAKGYPK